MNQATLTGRLAQDPDITEIPETGTKVAKFTIACNGSRKDKVAGGYKTEWIDCAAYAEKAEIVQAHLHKGNRVLIQGDLNTDKYTDRDGKNRSKTFVSVYKVEFLEPKQTHGANIDAQTDSATEKPQNPPGYVEPAGDFDETDDDLPY